MWNAKYSGGRKLPLSNLVTGQDLKKSVSSSASQGILNVAAGRSRE